MATEEGVQRIAKSYVHRLARTISIQRAILTGSWATGDYMEDSDIDIIVVSDDFAKMSLPERLKYLQREWKSRIPLEAFGYTENEFRNLRKKSTYVKDAIRNGISIVREAYRH
jgi:predicted nucleotidyltransferase